MVELFPWQAANVDRLVELLASNKRVCDLSETGTGKTFTAAALCARLKVEPIIVAPLAVLPAWGRAMQAFGVNATVTNYEQLTRGRKAAGLGRWSSRDLKKATFRWFADRPFVIFDEAHRAMGEGTRATRLVAADCLRGLLLSATLVDQPRRCKLLGQILGMHDGTFPSYRQFFLDHGGRIERHYGRDVWRWSSDPASMRPIYDRLATISVRTRIEQLGSAFPDNQVAVTTVPTSDCADVREAAEELRHAEPDMRLAAMTAFRQASERAKVPHLLSMAQDLRAQGRSVAIFVGFRDVAEALAERLDSALIIGGQSSAEREATIQDFQSDAVPVIVSMVQAGGVGISLHDARGERPRTSLISPGWSAVELRQALGRIHRAGAKSPAQQRLVYGDSAIDTAVIQAVGRKLAALDTLDDYDLCPLG